MYTFSFSLSYCSSTVLVLSSKMLMPSGLFCNDSLTRKNKFLRKSKESTPTLYSALATVRKACDAHSAALTEFSIEYECTMYSTQFFIKKRSLFSNTI